MSKALWLAVFWIYCALTCVFVVLVLTHWGPSSAFLIAACACALVAMIAGRLSERREHMSSGAPIHEYDKVLVIEGESPSLREIAEADLVVYGDSGRVMKDRYGALRTLNESELRQAKERAADAA